MMEQWNHKIFGAGEGDFEALALEAFHWQYDNNALYRSFVDHLGVNREEVYRIAHIPFLPIRFFKSHEVKTSAFDPALVFESSGTTGSVNSRHYVKDPALYEASFANCFRLFYGDPGQYCVLGLLPSYLERNNSSLVYMVNRLIETSGHPLSGFYLDNLQALAGHLKELEMQGQKTLLIGVTFALLDLAEQVSMPLQHTLVMETGGMKGRREELVREEVHERIKSSFLLKQVHSEYGMTELLSQAYSKADGKFNTPPWMKVLIRDTEDPLSLSDQGSGAINVIDLANIHSCCFIATDDVGRIASDGSFEVLGRLDGSDLRGCSLLTV